MRTTLNISFPDDLYLFIRERVETGAFASVSEYIRTMVREDYANSGGRTRERPKLSGPRKAKDLMVDFRINHEKY
jgi:Arc/MetJ-type ribon-helix-helix transcriptional regulator